MSFLLIKPFVGCYKLSKKGIRKISMFNLDAIEEEIIQSLNDLGIVCAHIANIYVYGSYIRGICSDKLDIGLLVIIPF